MTHGFGHDMTATTKPPPILSPNLQSHNTRVIAGHLMQIAQQNVQTIL